MPGILVGNKIDLCDKRDVTYEEGKKLADRLDYGFVECSALAGENIESIFTTLGKMMSDLPSKDFIKNHNTVN